MGTLSRVTHCSLSVLLSCICQVCCCCCCLALAAVWHPCCHTDAATQVAHLNAEVRTKQCVDYFKMQQQLQTPDLPPAQATSLKEEITILLCHILGRSASQLCSMQLCLNDIAITSCLAAMQPCTSDICLHRRLFECRHCGLLMVWRPGQGLCFS